MPDKDAARSGGGEPGAPASGGPPAAELTADDLALLGAEPPRRSDPADIGPYRVLARLGGGGMGRLYLGRDACVEGTYASSSLVAVKVIRSEYAEDERFRRRFGREIEAVRRVHGAYTAELLGSGLDHEELLWMATSYVPGLSLADAVLRCGPLPAPLVRRLAYEIGQALTAIAAVGIVHRDLKPSNVLLGADGARVIDFGVAHTTDGSALTMTGQHLGTPAFMSPEQADGREVGTASDVFSLGSVLALAATGSTPFGGASTGDVIHRVIYSPPSEEVLAAFAERDPVLAELVGRCLDKDPGRRPSPQDVVTAMRETAPGEDWPAPVAEVIRARGGWTGRAVAVSPVDQLTVLRRTAPERARQQGTPKRRLPLVLASAAAVVTLAAVAVFAFGGPGGGGASAQEPATTAASPPTAPRTATGTVSPPARSARPSGKPRTARPHAPVRTVTAAPPAPAGDDAAGQAPPAVPPAATVTVTVTVRPGPTMTAAPPKSAPTPTPSPKPWKACAYYSGTAITKSGDTGGRVKEVQCILKARGYNIGPSGVDGIFGQDTLTVVRKFQSDHHLSVDGQVGQETWPVLRA
ncbi:protein kinase [Streptomyces polygonati]|uniref:Protein kinase n=1 Tax=Streptomyces polygonati TaxID=1617087 RepID=A0ABV8HSI3_9ACTN